MYFIALIYSKLQNKLKIIEIICNFYLLLALNYINNNKFTNSLKIRKYEKAN